MVGWHHQLNVHTFEQNDLPFKIFPYTRIVMSPSLHPSLPFFLPSFLSSFLPTILLLFFFATLRDLYTLGAMHHAKAQVVRYFWNISDFLVFFDCLFASFSVKWKKDNGEREVGTDNTYGI